MGTESLQERFKRMDWRQQLGNLASTLARVSTRAASQAHDDLTVDLLQEAALFIEWGAQNAPENFLLELAAMQKEILTWRRTWPLSGARPLLAMFARNRSDRLLEMTGLLKPS